MDAFDSLCPLSDFGQIITETRRDSPIRLGSRPVSYLPESEWDQVGLLTKQALILVYRCLPCLNSYIRATRLSCDSLDFSSIHSSILLIIPISQRSNQHQLISLNPSSPTRNGSIPTAYLTFPPILHTIVKMAPYTIQRPASAPLQPRPRSDLQLAADAWHYIHRQIRQLRERRHSGSKADEICYKKESADSIMSDTDTLVAAEGCTEKKEKVDKE